MRQAPKLREISEIDLHNLRDSEAKAKVIKLIKSLKSSGIAYRIILDKGNKNVYVEETK